MNEPTPDPLPWLLEPENPSARYLALRHLLEYPEQDSQVAAARLAIPAWPPVREILAAMDPIHFWGRADRPFFGGAVGTHATLNLLAELGLPRTPQIEAACESLLTHGQHADGGFTHDGTPDRVLTCYTGNAIRTLVHFGYLHDRRTQRAIEYLTSRSTTPGGLACPYADGEECQWGVVKALGAYAALRDAEGDSKRARAVRTLAGAVLDHAFEFDGRDANWLEFGFPLNNQSDLAELCNVLARLGYGADPRLAPLLDRVVAARTPDGRWINRYGTRALQVEKRGAPGKWLTIRALQTIEHAPRAGRRGQEAVGGTR